MDNLSQKVTKYISENPGFIAVIILALLILIIWLYLKSSGIISKFSSKSDKKIKITKDKDKDDEEPHKENEQLKKKVIDPTVAQLVKDINQNM